ncbi:MAG: circularly permuted type 2 ATP-grasp protein, partial [Verrucomicrobiota bacterium]|nr:circularly permuted type 2 ATP-grasp protein [Verrucomicrobiota bacterium]
MGNYFGKYEVGDFYDEMFAGSGVVRPHYRKLLERFGEMTDGELARKQLLAGQTFINQGITFTVYNDNQGTERIFPFDPIPRIIPRAEWEHVERGLIQRIT